MYVANQQHRLELPDLLRTKMLAFRRRVWAIKLAEAMCGAALGVCLAYLATFLLDRLYDTPARLRTAIFGASVLVCSLVPLALHRWVWRRRRLEQLARLLSRTYPSIGDQLLGIIELAASESEQARSLVLCEAAIQQVAEQAEARDFDSAVPKPRHVRRAVFLGGGLAMVLVLAVLYPAAASNAWLRFVLPWRAIPRYTFAMIEPLPDELVVAHGEPFSLTVHLAEQTVSQPLQAVVSIGGQPPVAATLADGRYDFDLPPQIDAGWLDLRVGDYRKRLRLAPTLRPELSSIGAEVTLPAYLGRRGTVKKDVRGGVVSLVNGSEAVFTATGTRELASATVNGQAVAPTGSALTSPRMPVQGNRRVEFQWQDRLGLGGKEPFVLTVNGREDEAPTLACDGMPTRKVVLDSEHLTFKVTAQDDYGIKVVGMDWQGLDSTNFKKPASGERVVAAGAADKDMLELSGTFSAVSLGIEPQPIRVRLFVEDFFPGRPRVYSPAYVLYVLNAEQHAIWLTEQLSKWHRQSLEVRDRELQLFEMNKQLRRLSVEEINQPNTRRRIETQAEAERANGRRLSNLVVNGDNLIKQAMRNPEFGVGHLEKWAAMLQILKDISGNRMPSVADLLKQAAQAGDVAQGAPAGKTRMAGQVRASASGKPSAGSKGQPKTEVPTLADVESSQQPPKSKDQQASNKSPSAPRFGLPNTMLQGGGSGGDSCPASEKMDEAIAKQQDLLAEFEKVADELNRVLASLEGSTLVKRLKAASRLQYRVAGRLGDTVSDAFGAPSLSGKDKQRTLFKELATQEARTSQDVSNIMDDMQSYFERRRFIQFKTVLDEMRKQDAVGSIRQLSDDLQKESGLSMAQCEYWSDTLDRWAEDLVDPASGGT